MEEEGRVARGVLVCHVPERHKHGHRDIVIRETASHGHCFFLLLSSECLNVEIKVGEKKMYGGFFFVGLMLKKSEVESREVCVLLELASATGTITPSLRTSHPFIDFHSVFYRTPNRLFSPVWYYSTRFFKITGHEIVFSHLFSNLFLLLWCERPLQKKRHKSAGARRCFFHSRQP